MINLKIKSPSKINIGLNVYEKEFNNKHKIMSIFMLINDYEDEINIEESDRNFVSYIINEKEYFIHDDSVSKILNFLVERKQINNFFNITIKKFIPFNAGLGGSSSNAGVILKELCRELEIELTYEDLEYIALYIGSDIPFFASGFEIALVCNYGDEIYDLSYLSKPDYELIPCKWDLTTKLMYEKFDSMNKKTSKNDYKYIIRNWNNLSIIDIKNDLFIPAILLSKEYFDFYKEQEIIHKKNINMSGSGSYLYFFK